MAAELFPAASEGQLQIFSLPSRKNLRLHRLRNRKLVIPSSQNWGITNTGNVNFPMTKHKTSVQNAHSRKENNLAQQPHTPGNAH